MLAATAPRARTENRRLMLIDGSTHREPDRDPMTRRDRLAATGGPASPDRDPMFTRIEDRRIHDLPALLDPGDLLVLNDAATFPASIRGATQDQKPIELRLLSDLGDKRWRAVLFGAGDWRTPTEHRPPPPRVAPGETIALAGELTARVAAVSALSPRLLELEFTQSGDAFWAALYACGDPVQYSYLARPVHAAEMQTAFAVRPWAAEPPSAGLGLAWSTLLAIKKRGVRIATLTHAAGLSATGDDALDAALPLEERYHLPESTVRAISETQGRIIAAGTTVARALEGAAEKSPAESNARITLRPGEGTTTLKLGATSERRLVGAILTGVHESTASHYALLEAFAPRALLHEASIRSVAHGYLGHEFGDAWLVFGDPPK